MLNNRKNFLLLIAGAGVIVKIIEFLLWYNSPFRFYNYVEGLDMPTLMRFSEWGTRDNGFIFTFHRALIAFWWKINGNTHFLPGIIAIQALCGIAGAVICADLALRIFNRDRIAALFCALIYLLYAPFFIYEFSVLQEALSLFLIFAAFYAAIRAKGVYSTIFAGIIMAAALVGRPTAIIFIPLLFCWMIKRRWNTRFFHPALLFGSIAVPLILISLINLIFGGNANIFFNVLPYSIEFNATSSTGISGSQYPPLIQSLIKMIPRIPQMFLPTEIPENLNYYFLDDVMTWLRFLPNPTIIIPLVAAGILLMIPQLTKANALILLPIISLVLPLCVREPIGRYRITLLPYFILAAGYWLHFMRLKPYRKHLLVATATAFICFIIELPTLHDYHRSSDYLTHAIALEQENGGLPSTPAVECLYAGWEKSSFKNNKLGVNIFLRLAAHGERSAALSILSTGIINSPEPDIFCYYSAIMCADSGDFSSAEKHLKRCNPGKLGFLTGKYHYLYGEIFRKRGEFARARKEYTMALEKLDKNAPLVPQIKSALNGLVPTPKEY